MTTTTARQLVLLFIVCLVMTFVYFYFFSSYMYQTSNGKIFKVRRQPAAQAQAKANTLNRLDVKIQTLLNVLKMKQINGNIVDKQTQNTQKLIDKYVHSILHEAEKQKGLTSYTINNSKVYLCLNGENESDDLLFYVTVHEL